MAVVYETATASTPLDLLDKFKAFASANGWEQGLLSDGTSYIFHASAILGVTIVGDNAAGVWTQRGLMQFDTGLGWDHQVNASPNAQGMNLGVGPFTAYHFYSGSEAGSPYLHVTVEVTASVFRHLVIGQLVKYGTVSRGIYSDCTWLDTNFFNINNPEGGSHRHICDSVANVQFASVQADFDSKANNWVTMREAGYFGTEAGIGGTRTQSISYPLVLMGAQNYNLRTPIYPCEYYANRASGLRSPIGRIPNFGGINITNFSPGELVTYGSENWQVFPVFARTVGGIPSGQVASGGYGYAHLR
jgi:hypothetical protein